MNLNQQRSSNGCNDETAGNLPLHEQQHDHDRVCRTRTSDRKKSPRSTAYGALPSAMSMARTTTVSGGRDVARSMGGVAALPSVDAFSAAAAFGLPSAAPAMVRTTAAFGGAKLKSPSPTRRTSDAINSCTEACESSPSLKTSSRRAAASSSADVEAWHINDEHVHPVPPNHPLELTAVFVPHASASVVALRVSDAFRLRSISARYDDSTKANGKAKAKCTTRDGVDFRVRLYRGKGKFSHGIIVEVQRRWGFSTEYQSDVRAILDAAEGKEITPPPALVTSSLPVTLVH